MNPRGDEAGVELPVSDSRIPRMTLPWWEDEYGITAGITTRANGSDFGLQSPRPAGEVLTRWLDLIQGAIPGFGAAVVSRQVHGAKIALQGRVSSGLHIDAGFDGHATVAPALLLAVTVADCVPVYLAIPGTPAVALLHAGWRGVAAGVLESGVLMLTGVARRPPQSIVMHCGVGICGDCYEVGPEVHGAVTGNVGGGCRPIDLRAELVARARRLGVERVTSSSWCTAHDRERFYSHRASGGADGRMVAYLGRPSLNG